MLSKYARRSDQRAAIATDIRDIFNAPSGGEAEAMLRARVEQYYDRNPELARSLCPVSGFMSKGRGRRSWAS